MTLSFFTEPACTLLINLTFNYVSLTTKFQAVVSSVTLSFQTLSLVILAFFCRPVQCQHVVALMSIRQNTLNAKWLPTFSAESFNRLILMKFAWELVA